MFKFDSNNKLEEDQKISTSPLWNAEMVVEHYLQDIIDLLAYEMSK